MVCFQTKDDVFPEYSCSWTNEPCAFPQFVGGLFVWNIDGYKDGWTWGLHWWRSLIRVCILWRRWTETFFFFFFRIELDKYISLTTVFIWNINLSVWGFCSLHSCNEMAEDYSSTFCFQLASEDLHQQVRHSRIPLLFTSLKHRYKNTTRKPYVAFERCRYILDAVGFEVYIAPSSLSSTVAVWLHTLFANLSTTCSHSNVSCFNSASPFKNTFTLQNSQLCLTKRAFHLQTKR